MQQLDKCNKKLIYVVGDIMLDEYIFGTVGRISPESCCPVLLKQDVSYQLGGAANVAYLIKRSGLDVCLCGVVGNDWTGGKVQEMLGDAGISSFLIRHNTCTTKKTRYVNNAKQQMFRTDEEVYSPLVEDEILHIESLLRENAANIHSVVFSDYNKGVLTDSGCSMLIRCCSELNIPSIVDVKVPSVVRYKGATLIKGNKKEIGAFFALMCCNNNIFDGKLLELKRCLQSEYLVATLGGEGMTGVDSSDDIVKCASNDVPIFDVTGAGDVVTAFMAMLINSNSFLEVLQLANKAAGIKVGNFGNSCVTLSDVANADRKILTPAEVIAATRNRRVVFTNGCFDILHTGHIDLLKYARSRGDCLLVALNGDDSVTRLKGKGRPVNSFEMRAAVLSAVIYVDYIVRFDDDTPINLIEQISPSVLVKGGDYNVNDIVGGDYVRSYGGIVETFPFLHDISTTRILEKR